MLLLVFVLALDLLGVDRAFEILRDKLLVLNDRVDVVLVQLKPRLHLLRHHVLKKNPPTLCGRVGVRVCFTYIKLLIVFYLKKQHK